MIRNTNIPAVEIEHGTLSGYRKHVRNKKKYGRPCAECKAFWRRYMADRRAKGKR